MKKWMTKTDAILFSLLLLLIGILFLVQYQQRNNQTALYAVVTVQGKEEMQIDLQAIKTAEEITLPNGIRLLAEHNAISFVYSDCPDQICVKTGILSHVGDVAACVPQKTVVTIQSHATGAVDVITY